MATLGPSTETNRERTSARARWALGLMVFGYLALALLAGAPMSPLTTPLPKGAQAPAWTTRVAEVLGLTNLGRPRIIVIALLLMAGLLAAFTVVLVEASSGHVRLSGVLWSTAISLAIATAAPILLSRDVFSYAAYARIHVVYHRNPYVTLMASFPHDPFVAVTSRQWLRTRSQYGPLFSLIGVAIVRAWSSPAATILAFKILSGMGIGAATLCTAATARAAMPARASLAAAVLGLNPVIVVHTVGGGHADALIAALLSAAMLIALTPRTRDPLYSITSPRAGAVTILLVLAVLVRVQVAPALLLWLWWVLSRTMPGRRVRVAAAHVALIAALSVPLFLPFVSGRRTIGSLITWGGIEGWASPAHLLQRGAAALMGWLAGHTAAVAAAAAVLAAFLLGYAALFARLMRTATRPDQTRPSLALMDAWGAALLLLALCWPYLLPWYGAWFLPFLGLMRDRLLSWIGVVVTALLAMTLIPADPFSGLTTWGVMVGVHYVAAPLMLLLLVVAASQVAAGDPSVSPDEGRMLAFRRSGSRGKKWP